MSKSIKLNTPIKRQYVIIIMKDKVHQESLLVHQFIANQQKNKTLVEVSLLFGNKTVIYMQQQNYRCEFLEDTFGG